MLENLKENLRQEKKILADLASIQSSMRTDSRNRALYLSSLDALSKQLVLLNDAIPELLKDTTISSEEDSLVAKKEKIKKSKVVESVKITTSASAPVREKSFVTINKKDKKEYLKKLKLNEGMLAKIDAVKQKNSGEILDKPNKYVIFSNKVFRNFSDKMAPQFLGLKKDLKKSNSRYMLTSYLSMAVMSMVIAFILGILIYIGMVVVDLKYITYFFIPFGLSGLALAGFYMYPSSEASSAQKMVSQELPFVSIHMAAIAGSNIEPVKIFKIIAGSNEYPNIAKEIRKVIAQIEIYGYDLVMSLKNVAKRTSNKDLAEMFSGLAANISSGGALKNYLEKKAEMFLDDYRLERQKYSELAGTFMDVYISILIAAPLILMMMFIIMNVAGMGMGGFGITTLLMFSVAGIAVANVVFLVVLNMKQPKV